MPRRDEHRSRWRARAALAALAAGTALASPAAAQQRDTAAAAAVQRRAAPALHPSGIDRSISPGGAFVRALVLPGWGHASIGAYTRGGFYFAAEATTGFLLARTIGRLGIAKEARDLKESRLREDLVAEGITADTTIERRLGDDPEVARARRLVRSRHQQVEDWAAIGVFLVFIGGADAFVSAHLRDLPKPIPISLEVAPAPAPEQRIALGLRLALGRSRPDR